MKASEVIKQLKWLISKHGDQKVVAGGTDYPSEVSGIGYTPPEKADGYNPANSFHIW